MMSRPLFPHIYTQILDGGACWCGPLIEYEEQSVSLPGFLGSMLVFRRIEKKITHYEEGLLPRRNGQPRRPWNEHDHWLIHTVGETAVIMDYDDD